MTSGFRSIYTQLTQLSLTINELKNTILLEKNISRKICTDLQFTEKYGMEFPCKTLADFMQFEENLKNDAFRQDFVKYFCINNYIAFTNCILDFKNIFLLCFYFLAT